MKYKEWKWTKELLTNQEMIDYQHQILFSTINDLIRACNMSEDNNNLLIEVALDELVKYTSYHFREEEGLMEQFKYEGLPLHSEQHANFTKVILDLKTQFEAGEAISDKLILFMEKWLTEHIMTKDKEAMVFCR